MFVKEIVGVMVGVTVLVGVNDGVIEIEGVGVFINAPGRGPDPGPFISFDFNELNAILLLFFFLLRSSNEG